MSKNNPRSRRQAGGFCSIREEKSPDEHRSDRQAHRFSDGVRRVAAGHEWGRVMWDRELRALFEALLSGVRVATGRFFTNVPLDLGRLPRTTPQPAARVDEGALLVANADRIDLDHLQRRRVLLGDASVRCERDSEWVAVVLALAVGLIVLSIRQLAKICQGF